MILDPVHCATVAAIVQEGSLDQAARALGVTASAVSQRLRALESQTGRVLVVRSKPARATEAGQVVIRLAKQFDLLEHDAESELGLVGPERTEIAIAVNADSLATWLLPPLQRVTDAHAVTFDLRRDDEDLTATMLEDGTVMAAVTSRRDPIAGCVVTPLGSMPYEAVATPAFVKRWLQGGGTATELASAPLIDFDRSDDIQSSWLRERGVNPDTPPRHYIPGAEDYAAAVRLGLGWGMLPPQQSEPALESGRLVGIGEPVMNTPLYWQQWNLRSPVLSAVRDAIVEAARAALEPLVTMR